MSSDGQPGHVSTAATSLTSDDRRADRSTPAPTTDPSSTSTGNGSRIGGHLADTAEDLVLKVMIMTRVVIDSFFLIGWALLRHFVHQFLESNAPVVDDLGGWELTALELIFDAATLLGVLLCVVHDLKVIYRRIRGAK